MIVLSIDSHVPEVFEKIRPGADAQNVYKNVETTARLSERDGIECIAQIVFMTENTPMLAETIAWLAEAGVSIVNVIQLIDSNRRSWHLDPTLHFSAEYIDWIRQRCRVVAEEKRIKLGWDLGGIEWLDFREEAKKVAVRPGKRLNDERDERLRLRHPGYCRFAYDRIRVRADGDVSPCCFDGGGELRLGNLAEQHFADIWNGPTAQDLRRGHYTWDYPSLCASCRLVDLEPEMEVLPFLDRYFELEGTSRNIVEAALTLESPTHMSRLSGPPTIEIRTPDRDIASYKLLIALGGEWEELDVWELVPSMTTETVISLSVPAARWRIRTNVGYWWGVIGLDSGGTPIARSRQLRCLIAHEQLPRVAGSTLRYANERKFTTVYLGGKRDLGFAEQGVLPSRPPLVNSGPSNQSGARFSNRRLLANTPAASRTISPAGYEELLRQVMGVVDSALPDGSRILVVSKGDEALLQVGSRSARHFPSDELGRYLGHHPSDSEWAIGHLEVMRATGYEYLLFPTSALWWLEHYDAFRAHLEGHYSKIVEDQERCIVFDLTATHA